MLCIMMVDVVSFESIDEVHHLSLWFYFMRD